MSPRQLSHRRASGVHLRLVIARRTTAGHASCTVNGVDLVYEDVGDGDAAVRARAWAYRLSRRFPRAAAGAADARTHHHLRPSRSRRFGQHRRPASYTLRAAGRRSGAALLDALGVPRCDLLGHSMGGMIALRFVLAYPERVASLVLMDTAGRAPDHMPRAPLAAAGAIARVRRHGDARRRCCAAAPPTIPTPPPPSGASKRRWGEAYWERRQRRLDGDGSRGVRRCWRSSWSTTPPLTERLAEIRCPTLVMVGDEDVGFLRAAGRARQRHPRRPARAHSRTPRTARSSRTRRVDRRDPRAPAARPLAMRSRGPCVRGGLSSRTRGTSGKRQPRGGANGRHAPSACARRSAMVSSTTGWWPMPRWLLSTSRFSLNGPGSVQQLRQRAMRVACG